MINDSPAQAPQTSSPRIAWSTVLTFLATILSVVGTQLVVLGIISGRFTKIENQIQASDNNRQADTRALNARVDAVQGLILSHAHQSP